MTKKKIMKKRGKTVELEEEEMKKLKLLSAELDISMKELGSEAVKLLLKKYKK